MEIMGGKVQKSFENVFPSFGISLILLLGRRVSRDETTIGLAGRNFILYF